MKYKGEPLRPPSWAVSVTWNDEVVLIHPSRIVLHLSPEFMARESQVREGVETLARSAPLPLRLRHQFRQGVVVLEVPDAAESAEDFYRLASYFTELIRGGPAPRGVPTGAIESVDPDRLHTAQSAEIGDDDWAYPRVKAEAGWRKQPAHEDSVLLGLIDSGIAIDVSTGMVKHPDLSAPRFTLGTNFVNKGAMPLDDNQHGTMVAGVLAARRGNRKGIAGMTRAAMVHVCKTLRDTAHGFESDFAAAVEEIVDAATAQGKQAVINYSVGGPASPLLRKACRYVENNGMLLCAAAGNDPGPVLFPARLSAAFSGVLAVGGINSADQPYGASGTEITVRAPATGIRSTKPDYVVSTDEYDLADGTSLACPFVAGLAALVWNKFPTLTAAQVRDRLRDTAQHVNGMRVIDVEKALT